MKITGLTATQVDGFVAMFSNLMLVEMRKACDAGAKNVKFSSSAVVVAGGSHTDAIIAESGGLFSAVDALGTIITHWAKSVSVTLMPFLNHVFATSAQSVASSLGDVPAVKTTTFIADMENLVTLFSNDMWDAAKESLIAGAQDGESIAQLAARVENVADVKAKKAHVIAQTTVIAAVNGGEWQQMMEAASAFDMVMTKEWVSTHDARTRPTHEAADGQVVTLAAKFSVGNSLLDFPGDPTGDPAEVISCRCTTVYDVDVDAPITASQTSSDALSTGSVVAINGPQEDGLTAAFNDKDHPRGKDGKFIKSSVVGGFVKDILAGKWFAGDLTTSEKKEFVNDLSSLKAEDWNNFKPEQKAKITKALENAVDEGVPGSAKATMHLDDIDDGDVSDVSVPNVFDPGVHIGVNDTHTKKDVEQAIYTAYDQGKLNDHQQQDLLNVLDGAGPDAAMKELTKQITPVVPVTPTTPTLTTGSSVPIKITHGLIHAKHTPGTTIAISTTGTHIVWNGDSYDIIGASGDNVDVNVKKSKLYALLNSKYKLAQWKSPGKQETEVSHASHLDAAPSAAPVPHPVTTSSTIDTGQIMDGLHSGDLVPGDVVADGEGHGKKYRLVVAAHGSGINYLSKQEEDSLSKGKWEEIDKIFNKEDLDATIKSDAASGVLWPGVGEVAPIAQTLSTPSVAQQVDLTGWKQVGGQTGSNKGGLYEAPDGKRYYVKSLKSSEHAKSEVLAAALYNAAGVNVPQVRHGVNHPEGWKNVIISPIVPNAVSAKSKLVTSGSFNADVVGGYAVDAWLANYDVVGLTHDNVVESDGKAWRIDVGGSLRYRAQGSKKSDWNDDPTAALNGLKNKSTNSQAASVFGSMSLAQEKESAKDLLSISDAQIDQMVKDAGLDSDLAKTLKARKKAILDKYGLTDYGVDVPAPVMNNDANGYVVFGPGLDEKKVQELITLQKQYLKGLMTTDEYEQQIELVKNGPSASELSTLPVGKTTDLSTVEVTELWHDATPSNIVIAWGKSSKFPNAEYAFITNEDGFTDFVYKTPSHEWKTAGFGALNNLTKIDVKWDKASPGATLSAPNSANVPSPSVSTPDASVTVSDLSYDQKATFYGYFKAEKVSPAWSGAKIYKSMHAAKQKMSGDAQIAALSDAEMLKLLDQQHHVFSSSTPFLDTPAPVYSDKVKEWLKTPSGVKAFKELNPNIATAPTSYGLAAKKFAKKAFKKVGLPPLKKTTGPYVNTPAPAKKVAVKKAASLTVDKALGDTSIGHFTDDQKLGIYSSFKSSTYGKYLNSSKPNEIFWNAVQQSKNHPGSTPGAILVVIDEQGAKKFNLTNQKSFENKVTAWLNTPSGKKQAAEILAGTWSPFTPSSSPLKKTAASSTAYPSNLPLDQKVTNLTKHIEPFDAAKKYNPQAVGPPGNDFPVITGSKAASLWSKWTSEQGPMSETQKAALKSYTGSSYSSMNDYLRGYSGATDAIHKKVNNAQAGMKLSTEPMVLHRGNGWFAGWASVAEIKQKLGTDFPQEAFFSSSTGGKSAFSGPINFIIEAPVGTPMAYVKGFSHYGSENEMLLAANITYRVVAVHEHDIDGSWHYNTKVTVVLRAIPHKDVT